MFGKEAADLTTLSHRTLFVLLDGYSMISFASAIDPLRIANKLLGRLAFRYECASLDGKPVESSCGFGIEVSQSLDGIVKPDLVIVCSSDGVENLAGLDLLGSELRKMQRHGVQIGSICTGSYVLAKYGLLQDQTCAIHWEYLAVAKEMFPSVDFKAQIFVQDENCMSAGGGTAPIDMMIKLIHDVAGAELAVRVADIAIHSLERKSDEPQKTGVISVVKQKDANLARCLSLMEENIEEPLSTSEISEMVGISRRQIERTFMRYLNTTPRRYYLDIRLEHASYLIRRTDMRIDQITFATGFVNSSHFSKAYLKKYGKTPSADRKTLLLEF